MQVRENVHLTKGRVIVRGKLVELRKVGPGRPDEVVSLSERGKPLSEHGLLNAFRRACKRGGRSTA